MQLSSSVARWSRTAIATACAVLLVAPVAYAQSPWERVANNLEQSLSGPIAKSLTVVAIIFAGAMVMFGEHGAMRQIAHVVFGAAMVLFASQFMLWLF